MKKLYIAFHKPYGVLSQFTSADEDQRCLSEFNLPKEVYCAGRLDKDSEGLLILTNDGPFSQKVTNPKNDKEKTYHVQVEGLVTRKALDELQNGVVIKGTRTKKAKATLLSENFSYPARVPAIRERKNIPTCWIELIISEGRNRQVRRMCAAVGFPCLRLIRTKVGHANLKGLKSGDFRYLKPTQILS